MPSSNDSALRIMWFEILKMCLDSAMESHYYVYSKRIVSHVK